MSGRRRLRDSLLCASSIARSAAYVRCSLSLNSSIRARSIKPLRGARSFRCLHWAPFGYLISGKDQIIFVVSLHYPAEPVKSRLRSMAPHLSIIVKPRDEIGPNIAPDTDIGMGLCSTSFGLSSICFYEFSDLDQRSAIGFSYDGRCG
jgi:hypothetical protein